MAGSSYRGDEGHLKLCAHCTVGVGDAGWRVVDESLWVFGVKFVTLCPTVRRCLDISWKARRRESDGFDADGLRVFDWRYNGLMQKSVMITLAIFAGSGFEEA